MRKVHGNVYCPVAQREAVDGETDETKVSDGVASTLYRSLVSASNTKNRAQNPMLTRFTAVTSKAQGSKQVEPR